MSFLPLSHVAANLTDILVMLTCVGTVYFADRNALKGTLTQSLREAQPTIFLGVPRVWEKIYEKMVEVGRQNKGLKQQIGESDLDLVDLIRGSHLKCPFPLTNLT